MQATAVNWPNFHVLTLFFWSFGELTMDMKSWLAKIFKSKIFYILFFQEQNFPHLYALFSIEQNFIDSCIFFQAQIFLTSCISFSIEQNFLTSFISFKTPKFFLLLAFSFCFFQAKNFHTSCTIDSLYNTKISRSLVVVKPSNASLYNTSPVKLSI